MAQDEQVLNDVGQWGEKKLLGYTRPLMVDGEPVDIDSLPPFGSDEEPDAEKAKVPLRP